MKVYAKLLENKKNIQPIVYLQSNVSNLDNLDNFVHAFASRKVENFFSNTTFFLPQENRLKQVFLIKINLCSKLSDYWIHSQYNMKIYKDR